MRPGPDAVTPLALLDVESLSDTGQVDALIALDRQIAWLQARQQRLIASFATRAATEDTRLAALSAARGGPARLQQATRFVRRLQIRERRWARQRSA